MKKLAMVGCGGIGEYHLSHFLQFDDIDLVAFCDIIPERAESFVAKAGKGKAYADFRKMYDEAKPDMIFIGIPPYAHGDVEREAIARGIHFFVEKPVALDIDLAREINEKAKAAGIITAAGFQCRYSSLVEPTLDFISRNKIVFIDCVRMGGVPGAPWWKDKKLSGGQIVEQTIHQFDIIRYCFGEPEELFSYGTRGFVKGIDGYDTDDLTTTTVKFKSGALGTLSTGCYASDGNAFDSRVIFSAESARAELYILSKLDVYEKKGEQQEGDFVIKGDGGFRPAEKDGFVRFSEELDAGVRCDREFIDAVITGDASKIRSPYEDAMKSLIFTMSCNISHDTGKPVKIVY